MSLVREFVSQANGIFGSSSELGTAEGSFTVRVDAIKVRLPGRRAMSEDDSGTYDIRGSVGPVSLQLLSGPIHPASLAVAARGNMSGAATAESHASIAAQRIAHAAMEAVRLSITMPRWECISEPLRSLLQTIDIGKAGVGFQSRG